MTREEILREAKPILFNTEMVKAVLDDRKTVTRRVIKPQPMGNMSYGFYSDFPNAWVDVAFVKHTAPYCHGDYLYVRETWDNPPVTPGGNFRPDGVYYYKADGDLRPEAWRGAWKPSIHLRKEAARIFLRVKNVRVEQLQSISLKDAVAEGAITEKQVLFVNHKGYFSDLWDSAIKPADLPQYGWEANPWVWVIEFEKVVPE